MGLLRRLNRPHPKYLSLGERDFDSFSLLPQGEGLGMRAVHPGIQQRHSLSKRKILNANRRQSMG